MSTSLYGRYIKRWLDIILSFMGIIVLSPIMLVTAFFVWIKLGSPVIFRQKRPGKDEKIFEMYKFRSMTDETDVNGKLLPDEIRLTSFGKKLRSTSLDELPELFNILKGDMSVVGPRPQLIKDLMFMTHEQRKRHIVRPGLTGLAQVNGRNNISWEEKFRWDLQYIRHISIRMDLIILFKTFSKVILSDGITTNGMETSEDLGDYLLRTKKIGMNSYLNEMEKVLKSEK